jgi:hypothetical protein
VRIAPERRILLRLNMKNLGGDEQVVRWQRSPIDHIREFLARVVRLGLDALHGSLLLAIVTMVLVE